MVNNTKFYEVLDFLISNDSPSGFTFNLVNKLEKRLIELNPYKDVKGNLYVDINSNKEKTIMISAHIDTLGFMIKRKYEDFSYELDKIGGPNLSTVIGEYVKVYTRDNKVLSGTIQSKNPSVHTSKNSQDKVEIEDLVVVLDTDNEMDVKKLNTGCYVCLDPKLRITNDFINSRFLDDKLCASILIYMLENNLERLKNCNYNIVFAFSTYEEVGHGMSHVNTKVDEFIALDMACVGKELDGSEKKVTICPKDSSGPYDYLMTNKLVNVAEDNNLDYALDIYKFYGSDASAARAGGNDIKAALIGPGVFASHGVERSHISGVENTLSLLEEYLEL